MSFSLDTIFRSAQKEARHRFWLFSDLQQSEPERAERYFKAAVSDFKQLDSGAEAVCSLGDAAEGSDPVKLQIMIDMQIRELDSLQLPVYHCLGNHEFDYYRAALAQGKTPQVPFFEAVKGKKNWRLVPSFSDFWFSEEFPEFTMLFLSGHASADGSWQADHQWLPDSPDYPFTQDVWTRLKERFADTGKPVFTFAHCAFPGGNRPSNILARMLPLPRNFRAHFYGHAHIGDALWAKENLYRQISGLDDSPVCQFNISSLDHWRGTTVRSAFFDYYGDGEYGVFFRDHLNHRWEQCFFSAHDARSVGIPEQER
ncbi:MAG: metallophosphoesterase [Lentisphaeria bacterium]|nr:metallophosphoesterase [Lentisphaeria bacterium]